MAIRGLQKFEWNFDEISLNLAKSSRHLKPSEAVIVQDIDFDDDRGGVVGRFGTKTINVDGATEDPLASNEFIDLFRATDTDTNKKYIVGIYDDLSNYKVAALCTTDGDKAYTTILATGGGAFTLTRGARLSFANYREPNIDDVIVVGTNGVDQPFYFKGTGGITEFQFGATGTGFKLKYLLSRPWRGHAWAALRTGEETTVHWSSTTNFLSWVETEGSGFRQCPQDDLLNAFRGFEIFRDRLMVFNLDSIGELFYTGNTDAPFRFRELTRDAGLVHSRAMVQWNNKIYFFDKRYPYLKIWNGANIELPHSYETIAKGLEKWVDLNDALNVRMAVQGNNLLISFKAAPTYAKTGTDGQRWIAVINLTRRGQNGLPYHPMSLWKIRANDIISVDEGTDFGQTYFADADAQNVGGTDYYFTRRICDWYDLRGTVADAFGDGNLLTDADATDVDNILQTGWITLPDWSELMYLSVDGEWEGTPSSGTTLSIKYRFDEESSFQTVVVTAVDGVTRFPVAGNAQGRRIQMRFEYSDNQSRPILHKVILWLKPKPGIKH